MRTRQKYIDICAFVLLCLWALAVEGATYTPPNNLTLWYLQPAESHEDTNAWMDYYLPLGNGHIGAMVAGGIDKEIIQLNEKTLWSGSSKVFGNYQNLGYLYIENLMPKKGTTADYHFSLDLTRAVAEVAWTSDTISYQREYFCSWPARCLVVRMTATEANLNQCIKLVGTHEEEVTYDGNRATMTTSLTTVEAETVMMVSADTGASVQVSEDGIVVTNACEMTIVVSAESNYDHKTQGYISATNEHAPRALQNAESACSEGWDKLLEKHEEDYRSLFGRVTFELNDAGSNLPSDKLVYRGTAATENERQALAQTIFAYGRYLLIASSRDGAVPANLQGIWCNTNTPAWRGSIHANINLEMNYWPAETTNLSETALPLIDWVYTGAMEQPYWRAFTKKMTDITEGWVCSWPNNPFGYTDPWYSYHCYCASAAWLCWHLWQHYLFTQDVDYLREKALPVMISSVDFWMQRLILDTTDSTWVCPHEWSPEQGPLDDGTAHTQQCVWNLFDFTLKAIDIVGLPSAGMTETRYAAIKDKFSTLDKGLHTEVYDGAYGSGINYVYIGDTLLREWKHFSYNKASEMEHRHMSHLMCLYPFDLLDGDPTLLTAARNSLLLRGERSTGWAMAWKLCLWARMGDGEKAYRVLSSALKHTNVYSVSTDSRFSGVYCNLFSAHPPFQIDGNFGMTAGIAEMLVQSQGQTLRLLPALPKAWKAGGKIHGMRAEGGFEVDVDWDGEQTQATIHSLAGQPCRLLVKDGERCEVRDAQDFLIASNEGQAAVLAFDTSAGEEYSVTIISEIMEEDDIHDLQADHFSNSKSANGYWYDLSGRRLDSSPSSRLPRGIYVKDGHKIVVR